MTPVTHSTPTTNVEPSSILTTIEPPPPPFLHENHAEPRKGR